MKTLTLISAVLALGLLGVSLAAAAEVSKESYKAAVEPICQVNTKANEKILKNVKSEVKAGKLAPAGASFLKAAVALKKTYGQLAAVPQPPEDAAKLTKWLGYVKSEAGLFENAGKLLKGGQKAKAQTIVNQLTHNAELANDEVLSFDFRYCKFEPSKFS
jgi:hypothetical protein